MTKPVTYLLGITTMLSVMSCNNETSTTTSTTTDSSLPADNTRVGDTSQVVDTGQPAGSTIPQSTGPTASGDAAAFQKTLSFKDISFDVKAEGKGSLQQLTIKPSGLSADSRPVTQEVEPVVGAEVADLNADSYPELLVYTQSAGSGSYGKVVAYSVNNGKSMSRVTFPATSENAQLKKGYMGHDKFTVVNNQLTQTFPLYKEGDANAAPSGKDRVVTYKLKNGEASRVFVVDGVKEVPHQ